MSDENKIQLEVEVSESSVDKSFSYIDKKAEKSAKASAAVFGEYFNKQENALKDAIDKIVGQTSKAAAKSAKESAEVFQEAFSKSSSFDPTKLAATWYLVKEGIDVASRAMQGFVNVALEGEQKVRLAARFDALAASAGVAADVLSNDMKKAVKGLVDDDKLLQLASEAFINIGSNAERLPEVLEVARKSYKVFGGDIISVADKINQAVLTGNTRILKGTGLYTDLDSAVKAYADKLGKNVKLLSDNEIQAARLNAILEKGKGSFSKLAEGGDGITESMAKAKVAVTELSDAASVAFSDKFGGAIKAVFDFIRVGADALQSAYFSTSFGAKELNERIGKLEPSIAKLQAQYENLSLAEKAIDFGRTSNLIDDKIKLLNTYKEALEKVSNTTGALSEAEKKKALQDAKDAADKADLDARVAQERIVLEQSLNAKLLEVNNARLASDLALLQNKDALYSTEATKEALHKANLVAEEKRYQDEKAALATFFATNRTATQDQVDQAEADQLAAHKNKMQVIEDSFAKQRQAKADAFNKKVLDTVNSTSTAIGVAFGNTLGQQLAKGGDAFANFGNTVQSIIGDMAISIGTTMIAQGLAIEALKTSLLTLNGFQAVAAGTALVAVGAALKAAAGEGANGNTGGGGTTGLESATDSSTSPVNNSIKPEDTQASAPGTAVNLTINGNVLDRRETGLELATILQEQFQDQGLIVRGA